MEEGLLDFTKKSYSLQLESKRVNKENKYLNDELTLCSCCRNKIEIKDNNISFLCDDNDEVFVLHNDCKVYFLIKLVQ
tara:strand:- start:722 stop:955 length:234 start_codon:yes stop_codon:yes gene_type:complete